MDNYKEYLDSITTFEDCITTFEKIELSASDLDATYIKVLAIGLKQDLIKKYGNGRVLSTCDFPNDWTTSVILLDKRKYKGLKLDLIKVGGRK